EDIKEIRIPRLLIEPLVENAVSHGIEPKSGNGNVTVELFEENKNLHIVVTDDGVGFEAAECLREDEKSGDWDEITHTHTGLVNTRRLLRILYDDRFRMKIQGKKGVGTRVEMILPVEGETCNVESSSGR
ncbi:MAG: two-component sensor histidine kinase, partial [Lachnospiraceae bacterium]|nr:two-component sensor histidine kinase [Lachnospiraceae bacterium]